MSAPVQELQPEQVVLRPAAHDLPRVNLLPAEILEVRRLRRGQTGLGAAVLVAILVVAALWVVADRETAAEQRRLDAASARRATLSREVAGLQYVSQVYRDVEARQQVLATAMSGEVLWSRFLADLSLSVPDDVWLTSMTVAPVVPDGSAPAGGAAGTAAADPVPAGEAVATITFVGKAVDHDDVAGWLDSLAKQKAYAGVYFTQAAREQVDAGTSIITFTSTATVTRSALSNRYVENPGG